jgi:hypothetical protein
LANVISLAKNESTFSPFLYSSISLCALQPEQVDRRQAVGTLA